MMFFLKMKKKKSFLHECVAFQNLSLMALLLDRGADINCKDERGRSPLHVAVMSELKLAMQLLLRRGADVNVQDDDGNTPLHESVNSVYLVTALLAEGASPTRRNLNMETPLHCAVQAKNLQVTRLLLREGVNVNVKDKYGDSPLHVAISEHCYEIAKLLLVKGSDINAESIEGKTPLHNAAVENFKPIMEMLLKAGADPNKTVKHSIMHTRTRIPCHVSALGINRKRGCTALHYTVANKSLPCVLLLLQNGADPKISDNHNETPLFWAVRNNSYRIAEVLLEFGVSVNKRNKLRDTPLHLAVDNNDSVMTQLLLMNGAEIDGKNLNGDTPLHVALKGKKDSIVEMLLEWGASLDITNNDGISWVDLQYDRISYLFPKYLVKLKLIRLIRSKEKYNLRDFDSFERCCLMELEKMKEIKFDNFSLFVLLSKYHDPYFINNSKLKQIMSNACWTCPQYSLILFGMLDRAKCRFKMLNDIQENITLYALPKEILREIMTYLSNDDLDNVIQAFE